MCIRDSCLRRPECSHQNNLQIGIYTPHVLERLQAVDSPHADIHEDQVWSRTGFDLFDSFLPARGGVNPVALTPEYPTQRVANLIVIIDNENRKLTILCDWLAHSSYANSLDLLQSCCMNDCLSHRSSDANRNVLSL